MLENRLKHLWLAGQTALNAWLTIPTAWTAEIMARAGYDAITIDMQHGLMDYQVAVTMLQAISTTRAVPLVRVPWNDPAAVMRMLDAGAYGIICPMVNSRVEAETFVGACLYPPLGYRSYGPIRANLYSGEDYYQHANQTILPIAMIETAQAMEHLEEILSTPGLAGVYVGTVDLSISLGLAGLGDLNDQHLKDALEKILAGIRKYGLFAAVHASSPQQVVLLSGWGFRLVTPITDSNILRASALGLIEKIHASMGS